MLRCEVTIRSYGAASTTFRKKAGWIHELQLKEPPPESLPAKKLLPALEPPHQAPGRRPSQERPDTGPRLQEEGPQDDEFLRTPRRNWAKLIQNVWLADPSLCATFGKPMTIVAAITSPLEDDVIERVLKAHPSLGSALEALPQGPWTSTAPTSHPLPGTGSEIIDPPLDVDQYLVDPPPDDD